MSNDPSTRLRSSFRWRSSAHRGRRRPPIDVVGGGTAELSGPIGSVADLAVPAASLWVAGSTIAQRLVWRDPVISAHHSIAWSGPERLDLAGVVVRR